MVHWHRNSTSSVIKWIRGEMVLYKRTRVVVSGHCCVPRSIHHFNYADQPIAVNLFDPRRVKCTGINKWVEVCSFKLHSRGMVWCVWIGLRLLINLSSTAKYLFRFSGHEELQLNLPFLMLLMGGHSDVVIHQSFSLFVQHPSIIWCRGQQNGDNHYRLMCYLENG